MMAFARIAEQKEKRKTMKNPFKNREEEIEEWRRLTTESPKVFFDELKEEYQAEYLNELEELRFKANLLTPAKRTKYRFRKILELLTSDEWLILHGWHSHLCDTIQDDFTDEEEKFIDNLGLDV